MVPWLTWHQISTYLYHQPDQKHHNNTRHYVRMILNNKLMTENRWVLVRFSSNHRLNTHFPGDNLILKMSFLLILNWKWHLIYLKLINHIQIYSLKILRTPYLWANEVQFNRKIIFLTGIRSTWHFHLLRGETSTPTPFVDYGNTKFVVLAVECMKHRLSFFLCMQFTVFFNKVKLWYRNIMIVKKRRAL